MATEAQKAYARQHYKDNKEKYKAAARKHTVMQRALLRTVLNESKKGRPCEMCGTVFPSVCMDYDHGKVDKKYAVSDMVHRGVSVANLQAEIAKCRLICSNCHRIASHVLGE